MTHLGKHVVEVRTIELSECQRLCREYHYAKGGSNTAVFRHGLLLRDTDIVAGCAWWIPPTKTAAIANFPEGDWRRVLALSRVVVEPGMPTNSASYLVGRSLRLVRQSGDWDCVITYADDWQGHDGGIYRATNWEPRGKTKPERVYVDQHGRMVARKAGPKTRTHAEMLSLGYRCLGAFSKTRYRIVFKKGQGN